MTNYDQRPPKIIVVIFNIYKNYEGSVIITLYPGAGRRGWEAREGGGWYFVSLSEYITQPCTPIHP